MSETQDNPNADEQASKAEAAARAEAEAKAKADAEAAASAKSVRVRLLLDCEHGRCNDVVMLPGPVAKQAAADGVADASKAAVAYALTLEQNAKA